VNKKSGIVPIELLAIVAVVAVVLVLVLALKGGEGGTNTLGPQGGREVANEENPATPLPVSGETDISTIEKEIDATVVGDFEADINTMEKDASGL